MELEAQKTASELKVSFETDGDFSNQEIAPLLLITFVENCFKHADLSDDRAYITIRLTLSANMLTLHCKNSINFGGKKLNNDLGAGIKNAVRRLELAYSDRYKLRINPGNDYYELSLNIHLK